MVSVDNPPGIVPGLYTVTASPVLYPCELSVVTVSPEVSTLLIFEAPLPLVAVTARPWIPELLLSIVLLLLSNGPASLTF